MLWHFKQASASECALVVDCWTKSQVMDPIVEVVALILGFTGWVMVGVALPNRYWRTSTVDGNVITTSTIYENLWMSCATDSTGVHNCREFPSLLALSGTLTNISQMSPVNLFKYFYLQNHESFITSEIRQTIQLKCMF